MAVDHKPLLGILNDKSLDIENPRLLMLKEKTLWFNFNVIHVAGRLNSGPDYISRTAGAETTTKEARVRCILALASIMSDSDIVTIKDSDIIDGVVASLSSLPVQAVTFEDIKREVSRDQEMQDLVSAISSKEGQDRFPDTVSNYNKYSEDLSLHYYPREASSSDLIKSLKEYFCVFGVAEHFSSDDGPQFRPLRSRSF